MISKQTLEIRWYELGLLPSHIYNWFQCDCPGKILDQVNSRTDYYLWTKNNASMSVKLRENVIEMKWKDNNFDSPELKLEQDHTSIWQGNIERWIKWRHNQPLASNLQTVIRTDGNNFPWIAINKKRWQKLHNNVEIEISEIKINQRQYWSLAFEMEENPKQSIHTFSQAITDVYKTTKQLFLGNEQCYAYPSLLLKHLSAIGHW
ncbi:hypothetical protein cce_1375 [Crocosphaera subtropica ATCC 51142]|uniref:CYTH domain-containing protein n=1 Tax=Crocosphaera subtropica (strain ATCC 51142 / BH68) TaxID=43989 RepID=B1WWK1_CROS5|nr:hypothetical protein [Crocosphaera subtropica]ACB50725.1 hypothetical protein cce_1375 [Crocosphaera subtropica ATCC 51142]